MNGQQIGLWHIYKSNYNSRSRMTLLLAAVAVWFMLILLQVFVTELPLPNWFMVPFPLLVAELLYILSCYSKYKAAG